MAATCGRCRMMTNRHNRHSPSQCVTCAGQNDRHKRHTTLGSVTGVTLATMAAEMVPILPCLHGAGDQDTAAPCRCGSSRGRLLAPRGGPRKGVARNAKMRYLDTANAISVLSIVAPAHAQDAKRNRPGHCFWRGRRTVGNRSFSSVISK